VVLTWSAHEPSAVGYRGFVDVTEATFDADVVGRSRDVPVVVDFWAAWCGPCRALTPVLEREIEARDGGVMLAKVDVDENPALAMRFGVSGIPAVKAFRDGRVVDEFVGVRSPASVAAFLDGLVAPPRADALVDELRASGELPEVVAALDRGEPEAALEWIVRSVADAPAEQRDRLREIAVALFERLGPDDPIAATYRRRLATALY
jgi:thioredoxin